MGLVMQLEFEELNYIEYVEPVEQAKHTSQSKDGNKQQRSRGFGLWKFFRILDGGSTEVFRAVLESTTWLRKTRNTS